MNPRPYSRMYQLTGTHGYANKYPLEEYCFRPDQIKSDEVPDHENLNMHAAISAEVKEALMKKYKHPIHQELEETAKKVGGHGGMDYIMITVWCIVCITDYHWIWMYMTWPNGAVWLNLPVFQ